MEIFMDFYQFTKGSPGPVGFDTKATSNVNIEERRRQEVSLIQLATQDICLLFQIYNIMGLKQKLTLPFPPRLKAFLEDPGQLMCGVGTHGDSVWLLRAYGIRCDGLVELSKIAVQRNIPLKTLATLDEVYGRPGREVFKTKSILSRNWDKEVLREEWIWYAAKDAFAGVAIFENLISGTPKPVQDEGTSMETIKQDHQTPPAKEEERAERILRALTFVHGIGKVKAPAPINQYWSVYYFYLYDS